MQNGEYKKEIFSGRFKLPHVQGVAVDDERKYMYFSFTTALIKTDMDGNLVGSVVGLGGHMGCIAFHDGKVYGSLEYKHDAIGKGVAKSAAAQLPEEDAFYIAVFDVEKIDRENIPGVENGEVMSTIYLEEVVDDYNAPGHRFGCSGIDGVTFAPDFGRPGSPLSLYVAYGVYSDLSREDNDHQVLLKYDVSHWASWKRPLSLTKLHHSGPEQPDGKYFVFTGNTTYGVQNLEYDPCTESILMAVYRGQKKEYPNYLLFQADLTKVPVHQELRGCGGVTGDCVFLKEDGLKDEATGVRGWEFPYGSTGMVSLGSGDYYFSQNREADGLSETTVKLYRWDGVHPFAEA